MLTLKAELVNGSSKQAKIETIPTSLFIRPSATDPRFPELYSNDGDKLQIVEIALDLKVTDGIGWMSQQYIESIAIAKLKKGKLVTNTGREVSTKRMDIGREFITPSGNKVYLQQGINFGYKFKGENITTKGIDQFKHFSSKGCSVTLLGGLKMVGTVLDVFSLFDWALDPKSKSLPIPYVPNIIGMALERVTEDVEEGFDSIVKEMLQKAKEGGVKEAKRFANSWKSTSGMKFQVLNISKSMAARINNGKFKTIDEVERLAYMEDESTDVTILYQIIDNPKWYAPKAIIECFFINTTPYE